jgi:competence ComEA-like helix-hairpin-helix protein
MIPARIVPALPAMLKKNTLLVFVFLVSCVGFVCRAVASSSVIHAPQQDANTDKDAPTFQRVCSNCHPLARVTGTRRLKKQWEEVIETMITSRGAKVTDEDFDTILGYLARNYGRVNVNQAPADELSEILAVPDSVAGAIVSYRTEHGTFADFDALTKVPGVDKDALEKKRDAIAF